MHHFVGVDLILLLRERNLYFAGTFFLCQSLLFVILGDPQSIRGRIICLLFDSVVRLFKAFQVCFGFSFRDVDLFEGGLHFTPHII